MPGSRRPDDVLAAGWVSPHDTHVLVSTLHALLRAESRPEMAALVQASVGHLGGQVIPVQDAEPRDLPVDVSLGVGEPLIVRLPDDESAAHFLAIHLASIVEDALAAARHIDRLVAPVRVATDTLTNVASGTEIGPRVERSDPGDAVCILDVDNFRLLNDIAGPAAGDSALRQFGTLLLGSIRDDDFAGRSGGDEFVVLLRNIPLDTAYARMRLLANKWRITGQHSTSVSVGIAAVDSRGGALAARAADRAMYRAKCSGRGLVELASPDDYSEVDS